MIANLHPMLYKVLYSILILILLFLSWCMNIHTSKSQDIVSIHTSKSDNSENIRNQWAYIVYFPPILQSKYNDWGAFDDENVIKLN